MKDYEYTDIYGDKIEVGVGHGRQALIEIEDTSTGDTCNVLMPPSQAEAIASAVAGEPVILIKESELPEVEPYERDWVQVDGYDFGTSEDAAKVRNKGLVYLAAARYLESQKNQEDEELDKLAEELRLLYLNTEPDERKLKTWRDIARKAKELLADGS